MTTQEQVEIDSLLAVHVMEWKPVKLRSIEGAFWSPQESRTKQVFSGGMHQVRQKLQAKRGYDGEKDKPGDGFTWSPSTTPADASRLMDALLAKGWVLVLSMAGTSASAYVEREQPTYAEASCSASSWPEALAKATAAALHLTLSPAEPAPTETIENSDNAQS